MFKWNSYLFTTKKVADLNHCLAANTEEQMSLHSEWAELKDPWNPQASMDAYVRETTCLDFWDISTFKYYISLSTFVPVYL